MVAAAGERDKLDEWAEAQLKAEEESVSAQYLSPEVTGYQALDEYGDWEETVEYGPVWIPHAAYRGWAPYRYGYWSHAYPWGPVWIDHYPWGFAPFHYGRWAYWNSVWCWVPGHFARSHFHDFHRPKVRDHVHPHVVGKKGVAVKSPRQAPPAVRKKGVAVKSPQQAAPAVNAPQPGRTIGQTPRVTRPAPQRQAPPAVNAPHAGRTIGQTPGVTSPAPQHPVHTGRPIGQKPGVTPPAPGTVGLPQSAPPPPFAKRGLPSSPPPAAPLGRLGLGASGPVAKPGFAAGRGPSASGGGGMRVNGR
jgi:hypothetical protein